MINCYLEIDDLNKMIFVHKESEETLVPIEIELNISNMKKRNYTLCTYIYGKKDPFDVISSIMYNHI